MCRGNAVSGASYGFRMAKSIPQDCGSSLLSFQENVAHSNALAGLLVSATACNISDRPKARVTDLTAFKHSSSGVVLDSLKAAGLQDAVFADNARQGPTASDLLPCFSDERESIRLLL